MNHRRQWVGVRILEVSGEEKVFFHDLSTCDRPASWTTEKTPASVAPMGEAVMAVDVAELDRVAIVVVFGTGVLLFDAGDLAQVRSFVGEQREPRSSRC